MEESKLSLNSSDNMFLNNQEIKFVRNKLEAAEKGGFTKLSKDQILKEAISRENLAK